MKKIMLFFSLFFLSFSAEAKIKIAASSQDLKSITEFIGREKVTVESMADGKQDLHVVEPRPSMVVKIKNADAVARIGLDLDMWMDSLIAAAKNKKVFLGGAGYIDASAGIPLLEKPQGKVDASMGDIHVFGNPHYWLDPENGKIIARNIKDGLKRVSPENADFFEKNYSEFCRKIDSKMELWKSEMKTIKNRKIITYHDSWIYFAKRFDLEIPMEVEPKPGIPPNPGHITKLINLIKKERINIILVDNFYPLSAPRKIAAETGSSIVIVPSCTNGEKGASDYFELFDYIIGALKKAEKN